MTANFPRIPVSELVTTGEVELKTGPFGTQLRASDYVHDGIPVINVRNIGFGTIRPDKLEYITNKTRDRLSGHVLRPDDIVFGRKGAVERHVFIRKEQDGWFQGSDCLRLRLKSSRIHPEFASYYFLTEAHQAWMKGQCSHGATMASLNQGILERIELPVPPLPTQRKIAGILSAYDDLIENNLRRIKILEQMAQSLYREWFVHFRFPGHESATFKDSELGRIPEGWKVKKLGEIAEQMRRGVPKGELDGSVRYVGLEHIPRQSLALDSWEETTELGSNKLAFKQGEVLFGKIRPYFHKVVVAPFDGICSADTIVIRAKKPEHRAMVTACVFTEAFVAHATATSNGSKMPRTDWKVLKDYLHVLPPNELLARFSALFENTVSQQQNLVSRNQTLRRTRDLLLPKLLSPTNS